MSRQPSPPIPNYHINPPATFAPPALAALPAYAYKQKQKQFVSGITAGVEDVKYQAKYKELKKKVKEIESDNDRLYFKLLLAKKNIRRMNLERAILYERLAAVPPTPGRHTQELPLDQDPLFHQQPPALPEHARPVDPNDRALEDYMRAHPNARLIQAPDGRVVAVEDTPAAISPAGVPISTTPAPPYGLPLVHGFRHDSGPGYDPNRQLPPLPPMIPVLQPEPRPDLPPINEHHVRPYAQSHSLPPPHTLSHSSSSHQSRPSSARPDLDPLSAGMSRIDSLPHAHQMHSRSPSMAGEGQGQGQADRDRDRDRSRRHDIHELTHNAHAHAMPHAHVQVPAQNLPTSPSASPSSGQRGSSRIHNHQRVGPGAHINRERDPEQEYERRRERELERDREREREIEREERFRARLAMEREEEALWAQEEAAARSHGASRSDSPTSGPRNGGSGDPSRPPSDQASERDHSRSYAPRGGAVRGVEREHAYEDEDEAERVARAPPAEIPAIPVESRKRPRDDMDVDEEYGGEIRSPNEGRGSMGPGNSMGDSRGTKWPRTEDDGTPATAGELRDERMAEADS